MSEIKILFYKFFTPLILCIIAFTQILSVNKSELTPWKGGGFGMFSSIDSARTRYLKLYLETEDKLIPIEPPSSLNQLVIKTRSLPTLNNLNYLVYSLLDIKWVYDDVIYRKSVDLVFNKNEFTDKEISNLRDQIGKLGKVRAIENFETPKQVDEVINFNGIRLELWRYKYDPTRNLLSAKEDKIITKEKISALNEN